MTNKSSLIKIVSNTKKLNVLYVEDNEKTRIQTIKMFKNYFNFLDVATDGEDGLKCYNTYFLNTNKYYDLVITDIAMPNMDGINMSKSIYKINKHQKIIIISAHDDKKYFIELINIGVEGFIQKPVSFEQITDVLKIVCSNIINNNIINLAFNCTYNNLSKELLINKKKIKMTINEHKFIEFLVRNYKSTIYIEDIFNFIYYDEPHKTFSDNSIKSLVKRLRKKLPDGLIIHNRITGYSILLDEY